MLAAHDQELFVPADAPRAARAVPASGRADAWSRWAPWIPSAAMLVAVAGWLSIAGRQTERYLSPVLTRAIGQTFSVLSQEAPPRALFQTSVATGSIGATPRWERVVAIASVLVLLVWLPLGLRAVWRRIRGAPVLTLLAAAAVAYLATFPLRFVPAAWETASRASEFLFVGVAALLAIAATDRLGDRPRRGGALVVCAGVAVLLTGGLIAGWPPTLRLSQPYRLSVQGTAIDPPGVALAKWSSSALGRGNGIAAETADARFLQLYGGQRAVAGISPDVQDVLHAPALEGWMVQLLDQQGLDYVAVNRRPVAADAGLGYFFAPTGSRQAVEFDAAVLGKFDRAGADRVFDEGNLVLYDVRDVHT